jgi:hypothetical protein
MQLLQPLFRCIIPIIWINIHSSTTWSRCAGTLRSGFILLVTSLVFSTSSSAINRGCEQESCPAITMAHGCAWPFLAGRFANCAICHQYFKNIKGQFCFCVGKLCFSIFLLFIVQYLNHSYLMADGTEFKCFANAFAMQL